jgi:hypothetical protein
VSDLQNHVNRLLDELAGDAREYLEMLERLRQLPPESEAYSDLEGELHAHILQVALDAQAAHDAVNELIEVEPEPAV